jgi:hypothetical protein
MPQAVEDFTGIPTQRSHFFGKQYPAELSPDQWKGDLSQPWPKLPLAKRT